MKICEGNMYHSWGMREMDCDGEDLIESNDGLL
jgi:hypothetical protein